MDTSEKFDEDELEAMLSAYKSEKRLMIRNLLAIHKELSLTELADHMQMSKTAVHHHLKILREVNIVEVAREEDARGSIDRKYFRLAKGSWRFKVEYLDQIEDPVRRFRMMRTMTKALQVIYREVTHRMELMVNLTRYLGKELDHLDENDPNGNELASLQAMLVENNTHLTNIPLGKSQYRKFLEMREEFLQDVNRMKEETDDENSPYLGILIDMPIGSLLEFNIDQL